MLVFSANKRLSNDGSNFTSVISDITDDVARMVIMIESGMRHFVDGKIDPDPKPVFTKKINGCTINMFIKQADLILLLPNHLDFNMHVSMFISELEMRLRDVETQLKMKPVVLMETNQFAKISREHIPKAGSLILPDNSSQWIPKRIFASSKIHKPFLNNPAAFHWLVSDELFDLSIPGKCEADSRWLVDRSTIVVNLTSVPIHRFTSHAQLTSIHTVLKQLDITNIVEYTVRNGNFNPIRVGQKNADEVKDILALHLRGDICNVSDRAKYRFVSIKRTKQQMTNEDCLIAFVNGEYTPGAIHYECQMCGTKQSGRMYALAKEIDPSHTIACAGFCCNCANASPTFIPLIGSNGIIAYNTGIPFSVICERYGIPKSHMILAESKKFLKRGYVRNARAFAVSPSARIHIQMLNEIVKFRDSVPDGDFVITNPS